MPLSKPWPSRATSHHCAGSALLGTTFWVLALALFVLPFVQDPVAPEWGVEDPTRNEETDYPFQLDVEDFDAWAAEEELGLEASLAETLAGASEAFYGVNSERLRATGLVDLTRLSAGEAAYGIHCAGCHGLDGDGAGPAARYLDPRPRNFRSGVFKFKSTGSGERPLRSDLLQTVTRGLSGSAMPDFRLLPEEKRKDIVEYVRYLAIRGEFERMMLGEAWDDEELPDADELMEIVDERWNVENLRPRFPSAAEPPRDQASVDRGRALFVGSKATCYTCHGEGGRGDGPAADEYDDDWGYPIRPRDLTAGVFRAGAAGRDLWLTIGNGIGGTPMPSYGGALTGEEIWDLVHFVQHIATEGASSD